jgi:hypothetical protein
VGIEALDQLGEVGERAGETHEETGPARWSWMVPTIYLVRSAHDDFIAKEASLALAILLRVHRLVVKAGPLVLIIGRAIRGVPGGR